MSDAPDNRDMELHETFSIASEFAPSVTLTEETFFEHGWQPLTICVLQAIWFLPADASFDVVMLVDWFKQLGWRSANGKPLGPDAIRRELGLIRKAGYINAARLQGEGGRMVGIHYTVSKRRSNSPQDGIPVRPVDQENRRSRHVPSFTTHGGPPHVAGEENRRSHHVPPITGRGDSPHMADDRSVQVAPCASNGVHPPHPPEEVTTSSPYPLEGSRPSQGEEGEGSAVRFTDEQLQEASMFLQRLPRPWTIGRPEAKKIAPLLLTIASEQGWQLDKLLTAELTKNPKGINSPARTLERYRIPNLVLFEIAHPTSARNASQEAPDGASVTPAAVECDKGCDRGYLELEDGVAPCSCLPLRQHVEA